MSTPAPGEPGGPPAGFKPGQDAGAPPAELAPSPEDDLPAGMPGEVRPRIPAVQPDGAAAQSPLPPTAARNSRAFGQASPFDLERRGQDKTGPVWDPWKGPDQTSGWWDVVRSPYTLLEGLGSGAAKGEAVMAGALYADLPSNAGLYSSGSLDDSLAQAVPDKQEAEALKAQGVAAIQEDARMRVKALTPDPNTTGIATQIIHGVAEAGELAITGSLVGGAAGAATSVGAAEGLSRFQDLREQGVDEQTALESAGLTGVLQGGGALLPGGLGSSLTAKIATGVAGNVTLGGVSRYADSAILEAGGYHEMAEQQKIWDGTQILADALLGAAFGGLAHLHAPGTEDAARTVNDSLQARRSAPGVPVDPEAAQAHQESLQKATADLMQGKPVDVSKTPRGDYLARPEFEDSDMRELLGSNLSEAEDHLAGLEAQLAKRLGGEEPVNEAAPPKSAAPRTVSPTPAPAFTLTGAREAPIVQFRKDATEIAARLPTVEDGMTRLWRGNRPGEVGQNPQFTNDLAGIALPFRKAYGGDLSYIDVPTSRLGEFENKNGVAPGAEFTVPKDLAAKAKRITPPPPERRSDAAQRRKVSEMGPDELKRALLTHDLTGLPNRRAYAESDKLPAQVSIDVDSLKWVNDNLGHEAGDQLLKAVGAALAEHPNFYHVSGDEFLMQAKTPEEAHEALGKVTEALANHTLEFTLPDGTLRRIRGLGVSYGVGLDLHEAEAALQSHKSERESRGLRAARGERPPGADAGHREPGGEANARNPPSKAPRESDTAGSARGSAESDLTQGTDAANAAVAERPHLPVPVDRAMQQWQRIMEETKQSHAQELARAEWEKGEPHEPTTINARDALQSAEEQAAEVQHDAPKATEAAVNCFLQKGS